MPDPATHPATGLTAWQATEEWAILLTEDGTFHTVDDASRANAEHKLGVLRAGVDGDPPEPHARLVTRIRLIHVVTGREQVTAWLCHPTPDDPPNPVPAFLRSGATC